MDLAATNFDHPDEVIRLPGLIEEVVLAMGGGHAHERYLPRLSHDTRVSFVSPCGRRNSAT